MASSTEAVSTPAIADHPVRVSTPEQDCIAFRSKDASMMPTRMPSSMGLFGARQVGVGSSLGSSTFWRRERRLLWLSL